MKGLVIGASSESIYAIKKLKERGVFLIGLDGNSKAEGLNYVDEKKVVDISDVNSIEGVLSGEKFNFIVPVPLGKILTTVGYLNDKYNLIGISYLGAKNCTDKFLFHKLLSENNLRNINSYLIHKEEILEEKKLKYPAILKPRYGSGSKGIFIIKTKEEFQKFKGKQFEEEYILEEMVKGKEYGIDGVILNNKTNLLLIREKENINCQAVSYYSVIENEIYSKVESFLQTILEVLKVNNVIFHADLIINEKDIFVIELSGRPSGHNLHNYFTPMVIGIDILDNYFNFLLNEKYSFNISSRKQMLLKYIELENCLVKKIPTFEELQAIKEINLKSFNCKLKEGQILKNIKDGSSIAERGFFILEGESKEDLKRQVEIIMNKFEIERIEDAE